MSADHNPFSPEQPVLPVEPESAQIPPMGIAHIMLWTLGSAILLAIQQGRSDGDQLWFILPFHIMWAITGGVVLAFLILLPGYLARGIPALSSGGHYLLLSMGIQTAILSVASLAIFALNRSANLPHSAQMMILAAGHFLAAVITLIMILGIPKRIPWIFTFLLLGISSLSSCLMFILISAMWFHLFFLNAPISLLISIALISLAVFAAVSDRAHGEGNDWLSLWGKAVFICSQVIHVCWSIVLMVVNWN